MNAEYQQQIDVIRANHPDSGGDYRAAEATLRALIASDAAEAAQAQLAAALAHVDATREAAAAADAQAQRILVATWTLVGATIVLAVATVGLVAATLALAHNGA